MLDLDVRCLLVYFLNKTFLEFYFLLKVLAAEENVLSKDTTFTTEKFKTAGRKGAKTASGKSSKTSIGGPSRAHPYYNESKQTEIKLF